MLANRCARPAKRSGGPIGWRFPNEKRLCNRKELQFTNNEKVNKHVKPTCRKGWARNEGTARSIMALEGHA